MSAQRALQGSETSELIEGIKEETRFIPQQWLIDLPSTRSNELFYAERK